MMTRTRSAVFASIVGAAIATSTAVFAEEPNIFNLTDGPDIPTAFANDAGIAGDVLHLAASLSAQEYMNDVEIGDAAQKRAWLIQRVIELATEIHVDGPSVEDLSAIINASMLELVAKGVTDPEEMTIAALNNALQFLDPHSAFIPESALQNRDEKTRGSFFGIGAHVSFDHDEAVLQARQDKINAYVDSLSEDELASQKTREEFETLFPALHLISGVKIVEVINDETPAAKAGIQPGDIITHVDGRPLAGSTLDEAVALIKGPLGSTAQMTVERSGEAAPLQLYVTRDEVKQSPVVSSLIDGNTGHIQVSSFNEQTDVNVDLAIADLTAQGAERFILDLRDNPGGLVTEADNMVENFIDGDQRLIDFWQKRDYDRILVGNQAIEDAFTDDNDQFDQAAFSGFVESLNVQEKRLFWTFTRQTDLSVAPDVVRILEEHGKIQPGVHVFYEPTAEDLQVSADNTFLNMREIDGKKPRYFATPGAETDAPVVVLVNGGSASASEIVSGALQSFGRAEIIGTQTFGKGSGQTQIPLDVDGDNNIDGYLNLTSFLYYVGQGGGYSLQNVGVTPDVVVSTEFSNVSGSTRTEVGMTTTIARPDDANYTVESQFECKPASVTVEAHGVKIAEYSTADMDDPFITCAMAVLNGMQSEVVELVPIAPTPEIPLGDDLSGMAYD